MSTLGSYGRSLGFQDALWAPDFVCKSSLVICPAVWADVGRESLPKVSYGLVSLLPAWAGCVPASSVAGRLGGVSVVTWWCLGGVLVVFRWSLVVFGWCLGGVLVVWWCLSGALVVETER